MTEKIKMPYTDNMDKLMTAMSGNGVLLSLWKEDAQTANAMTIGWGLLGWVWAKPVFQVVVRPSRYTFELLKKQPNFTVNVLPDSMKPALLYCGTKSGRDSDKLADCNLTVSAGEMTGAPVIDQSVIHYECRVVHTNDFIPEAMVPDIREGSYPSGDYHRVYWGQILDCQVNPVAVKDLK